MNLKEYIESFPKKERKELRSHLAKACGVSVSCIKHYESGQRNCPPARAIEIEAFTARKVTAYEVVFGDNSVAA